MMNYVPNGGSFMKEKKRESKKEKDPLKKIVSESNSSFLGTELERKISNGGEARTW